jgi:hypothetical protein
MLITNLFMMFGKSKGNAPVNSDRIRNASTPVIANETVTTKPQLEVDAFIGQMGRDFAQVARGPGFFPPSLKDPEQFTWIIGAHG